MKAKVVGGSLNLREDKSTSAAVLLILSNNMEVLVKAPGPVWSQVVVEDPDGEKTEGFAMTAYLEMIPEEAEKPKTEKKAPAKSKKKPAKKTEEK